MLTLLSGGCVAYSTDLGYEDGVAAFGGWHDGHHDWDDHHGWHRRG